MQFCVISPASGLNQWATRSKAHLVLAHVNNAVYQQFYRQCSDLGDLVILDNGSYEGSLDAGRLLKAIGLYRPKVVVLPDLLGGSSMDSFGLSKEFHDQWKASIPHVEWMYVPQGDSVGDFEKGLTHGIDKIQPEWVGLPRILGTDLEPGVNTRAKWAAYVHNRWPSVNVHCLGMLAGDVKELPYLHDANVASIDSSAPVWRGWHGYDVEDYDGWKHHGSDVNFNAYPCTDRYRTSIINTNLAKCGVFPPGGNDE